MRKVKYKSKNIKDINCLNSYNDQGQAWNRGTARESKEK